MGGILKKTEVSFVSLSCIVQTLIFVTGSGKRYTIVHIIKIELLAPRDRVSSQL